jgi:hypothetical protein
MLNALLTVIEYSYSLPLIRLIKILLGGLFDIERDNFYIFIGDSVHFFLLFLHQIVYSYTILTHEELFLILLIGHEVYTEFLCFM